MNGVKEAMQPFASMADAYEPDEGDDAHEAWGKRPTIGMLRRAREALAALEAAPVPAPDWQTIDSAPKDGTPIFVTNIHRPDLPVLVVKFQKAGNGSVLDDEDHWSDTATPNGEGFYFNDKFFSHWLPLNVLPAPPKPESST